LEIPLKRNKNTVDIYLKYQQYRKVVFTSRELRELDGRRDKDMTREELEKEEKGRDTEERTNRGERSA